MNYSHLNGFQSGFAPINDGQMYFEAAGNGQPVVFIHGMSLDTRMWDMQFGVFAGKYRVIRMDLRGFGKSSLPSGSYAHHDDVRALFRFLGIKRAHLVGLSMGGRVATDFALTYPEMTSALVAVDAVLHGYKYRGFPLTTVIDALRESGAEAARNAWLQHELFTATMKNSDAAAALREIVNDYSTWHWQHSNPWQPLDPPSITRLAEITAPTLVVVGEYDIPDFLDIADVLAQNIPNARKVVGKGAGHLCNMEAPEEFNRIVLEFFSTLPPYI